jgi:hypothetical protein
LKCLCSKQQFKSQITLIKYSGPRKNLNLNDTVVLSYNNGLNLIYERTKRLYKCTEDPILINSKIPPGRKIGGKWESSGIF